MVPHFDISTWLFTVVPGSMHDVKNQLQDLDGRTWLGTGYILSFVLFFFPFDLLVCVGDFAPDTTRDSGVPPGRPLSSLISVAPCAGTPSRQEHSLYQVKSSLMRSFHVRIYTFS
jgi:hypothetical protein